MWKKTGCEKTHGMERRDTLTSAEENADGWQLEESSTRKQIWKHNVLVNNQAEAEAEAEAGREMGMGKGDRRRERERKAPPSLIVWARGLAVRVVCKEGPCRDGAREGAAEGH